MYKFFRQKNRKNSGVTLVETLVALSIFSMSVVVGMVLLGQSISDTGYAKKKTTAAYLAQEGIEYVRNLRDTYILYSPDISTGWNAFSSKLTGASCQTANGCYFNDSGMNYTDPAMPITQSAYLSFTSCGSSGCPGGALSYNSITGKFGYSGGTSSGFTRKIRIETNISNEIKVFSTVFWAQGSGNYSMTFSETLFKWVE